MDKSYQGPLEYVKFAHDVVFPPAQIDALTGPTRNIGIDMMIDDDGNGAPQYSMTRDVDGGIVIVHRQSGMDTYVEPHAVVNWMRQRDRRRKPAEATVVVAPASVSAPTSPQTPKAKKLIHGPDDE